VEKQVAIVGYAQTGYGSDVDASREILVLEAAAGGPTTARPTTRPGPPTPAAAVAGPPTPMASSAQPAAPEW